MMLRKIDNNFRKFKVSLIAMFLIFLCSNAAFALPVPVAGSFAYDIYDIAVNQMIGGPIGFVVGVLGVVVGFGMLFYNKYLPAFTCILGSAGMIRADALVQTLGAMV